MVNNLLINILIMFDIQNDLCLGKTTGGFKVKTGLAKMTKGGLIMDVVNAEQAKIAENAGVRKLIQMNVEQLNSFV